MYCFLKFCNSWRVSYTRVYCELLYLSVIDVQNGKLGLNWTEVSIFKKIFSCMGPRFVHKALCVQWKQSLWVSSYVICFNWAAALLFLYFSIKHKYNYLKGQFKKHPGGWDAPITVSACFASAFSIDWNAPRNNKYQHRHKIKAQLSVYLL